MMEWIILFIFLILTIVLLSGKGGFLIAGYNTSGKAQKARYNEKKLCRVTGMGMGIITVLIGVQAAFGENAPDWFLRLLPFLIFGVVAAMIVLANFACKASPDEIARAEATEVSPEEKKKEKRLFRESMIFTAGAFVLAGIFLVTGDVRVTVKEDTLLIEGSYWTDYQIKTAEIRSVQFRENMETGKRVNGLGSFRLQEGNFRNTELGNYIRYTYTKCKSCVLVETSGEMLAVNGETEEETRKLYDLLVQKGPAPEA